jgi:hypothetical protein
MAYVRVLYQNFLGETEENYERPQWSWSASLPRFEPTKCNSSYLPAYEDGTARVFRNVGI